MNSKYMVILHKDNYILYKFLKMEMREADLLM